MRDRTALVLLALFACLLPAAPAGAEEKAPAVERLVPKPIQMGAIELLPFNDLEIQDFRREHGVLFARIQGLGKRMASLGKKLGKRKNKNDAESKKLKADLRRVRVQHGALRARLTDELMDAGVDGALIAYMNKAPGGARRVERYAYGLVLLLDDLSDDQRLMFERVGAQMEGSFLALRAQKQRTTLALKQAKLEKDEVRAIQRTFDRQERLIDQRFWQLTDFTLTRDQRARLWRTLPRTLRRKNQPVEHLYALPGLTPAQGTRLKALLTEVEHESSPDQAAVKRINAALKQKDEPRGDRNALVKERGEAYKRLGELRRYSAKATREILTDAQWHAYEAIPPRVNTNERRASYKRVLEGFKPSAPQQRTMKRLQQEFRTEQRAARQRMNELRREGEDYGADSPQMAGMQMAMQGAKADGERAQRAMLGRIFTEVLTPQQVSSWVMGHYGYKR